MKIRSAEFIISAVGPGQYPTDGLPQIALIGKSNVGKSSLINKLLIRKGLAKTSSVPGKTRTINFYLINKAFYLVDLPGFGYAKAPLKERQTWGKFIEEYFECAQALSAAIVLLDPRREAGESEQRLYRWLESTGVPVTTVFTKSDKLSKNRLFQQSAKVRRALSINLHESCFFSALTGNGRKEILKKIYEITIKTPTEKTGRL